MNGLHPRFPLAILSVACLFATTAFAEEANIESILSGLHDPRGVAVRPGGTPDRFDVFIAETGAGRIVSVASTEPDASTDVLAGFPVDSDDGRPAGPFALFFLDRKHLLVGCGAPPVVRMYELAEQPAPQSVDQPKQHADQAKVEAVYSFARTRSNDLVPDLLVVSGAIREWPAGLAKIAVRAGTLDKFRPLIQNTSADGRMTRGVTVSEQGYVVAAQSEPAANPPQTVLNFLEPTHGAAIMSLLLAEHSIIALAYSPTSGNLYALNDATTAANGGLYRIDDASQPGKPACKAVKIADIARPTALAFAPDGALYITATGEPKIDDDNSGKLLRLKPAL